MLPLENNARVAGEVKTDLWPDRERSSFKTVTVHADPIPGILCNLLKRVALDGQLKPRQN